MKAAVFDKDFIGPRSGYDHSSDVNALHIAFERHGIADRTALLLREFDAHAAQKIVVRMVPDQRQDKIILQPDGSSRRVENDVVNADLLHRTAEVGDDPTVRNAIL